MRGRRRERLRVESRVHDTNLRSVGEQNRCQVGPTILFRCPAQIPRSFLRSFSLWARHSAETSAARNGRLGAAEFFPGASRQGGGGGEGRREGREGRAGGAHNSFRVPRPDPPLLPSIILPLGPPFCGAE